MTTLISTNPFPLFKEPNQMGVKSPRRLKIALPQMQSDYEAAHPGQFSCSVKEKEGVVDEKEVAHLVNRPPRWSQDTCTFILNFSGRVQVSSVKNFQLMVDDSNGETLRHMNCFTNFNYSILIHSRLYRCERAPVRKDFIGEQIHPGLWLPIQSRPGLCRGVGQL